MYAVFSEKPQEGLVCLGQVTPWLGGTTCELPEARGKGALERGPWPRKAVLLLGWFFRASPGTFRHTPFLCKFLFLKQRLLTNNDPEQMAALSPPDLPWKES